VSARRLSCFQEKQAPVFGLHPIESTLSLAIAKSRAAKGQPHCLPAAAQSQCESAENSALIWEGQYRILTKREEKID
jgi:hypothetical protein